MSTNWADKTAETLRIAKEADAREQEQFIQNYRLILAQSPGLWNELRSVIQANVSKLTQCEPYLQFAPEGESAFRVTSWKGRDHMIVSMERVPKVQYKIYLRERSKFDVPNTEETLTFEVEDEEVRFTISEGGSMTSAQAAEYLLDALISI